MESMGQLFSISRQAQVSRNPWIFRLTCRLFSGKPDLAIGGLRVLAPTNPRPVLGFAPFVRVLYRMPVSIAILSTMAFLFKDIAGRHPAMDGLSFNAQGQNIFQIEA
jgi:hypothetical protein